MWTTTYRLSRRSNREPESSWQEVDTIFAQNGHSLQAQKLFSPILIDLMLCRKLTLKRICIYERKVLSLSDVG